ncbi:hypothetical protein [Ardenticatena maritima]|uniref:NnrS family protein n=1 Tax=Ardenticatena maritima TaxID=872965 RepID=A0A0N8GRN2_9CHLR|nr:hypothetical protein [Ardenticatena maritima]KPL86970.1 hypothetical protein SE16_12950 [Ardenticatena maritima]
MKAISVRPTRIWDASLALFVVAIATGVFYRYGMLTPLPGGLALPNVRHAHSHLMYFGWVTPLLMVLISETVAPQRPFGRRLVWGLIALAVPTWALFLRYGYGVVALGEARLPLATIFSSLHMLVWYAFAAAYVRATWGMRRTPALRVWDVALAFLVLASGGAWARAAFVALDVRDPFLTTAAVHLFLDLFSDGWFLFALLGVWLARFPALWTPRLRLLTLGMAVGAPLAFLLGVPVALTPPHVRWVASGGGLLLALGCVGYALALWREVRGVERLALFFLVLKATGLMVASLPAGAMWGEQVGLRIPYLHWFLLGTVSVVLLARYAERFPSTQPAIRGLVGAIVLVQVSLLPLTGVWPAALGGAWRLWFAFGAAFIACVAACWVWMTMWMSRRAGQYAPAPIAP